MALLNLVKMNTSTTGTGTMTLTTADTGYLTMAQSGAVNGVIYSYGIEDGNNREVGWGIYTVSGTTLTRNVVNSTNANALISLSGAAKVYITTLVEDFDPLHLGEVNQWSTTSPTTPSEGVLLYGVKRANRRMLGFKSPTGRTERVAPWQGSNNTVSYTPPYNLLQAAATITGVGAQFTIVTAATAKPYATTNFLTMQRGFQQTIATAAGMLEVFSPALMCSRNPGNAGGGFHACWRFGIVALPTDAKLFCGMTSSGSAMTNVNPNTLFNVIGLCKISTNTTSLTMVANGSSGTGQTTVTLPNTGTMTGIANTFWQVELFCKSGDTQFGFRVTRTSSTGVETIDEGLVTGTQGAAGGIPADATAFAPHCWVGNTTAVTLTTQFTSYFMESD